MHYVHTLLFIVVINDVILLYSLTSNVIGWFDIGTH